MFNKKLYAIIYLAFLFSTVFGKIMTKDEVLKINPSDYKGKEENQCPDFSNGNYWYLDRCGIEFYCKDKTCSSATRNGYTNTTVEFQDANGNMKVYIADVCNPAKDDCKDYPKCNSNCDCLSDKCEKNYCVPNDNIKFEKCQDTYHYHILTFKETIDMKCGKPDLYSCKRDSDCASDICKDGICQFQGRDHKLEAAGSYIIYFVIFVIICIIGCISCCCCCCRHKKSRSVNDVANSV